jgi:hypothetical protein
VRQTRPPVRKDRSSGSGSHDFDGGGSLERSLTPANTILPPGFQSANPSRENRNANDGQADIPIQDVLQILGINAEFSGDGWKVGSAVANGAGYRAGIREGDVIEAIDGQTLTRDTKFKNGFNGKTLRVRRDRKSISLRLGN